jgi:hypothetical protein
MQFKQVSRRTVVRRVVQATLLTGCLATTAAAMQSPVAVAQGGLTLFSGVERGQQLSYAFDYGGYPNQSDRLNLKLKKTQMKLAVSKFVVTYPNYFDGKFNPNAIEIKANGKSVPVSETSWDKDNYRLEIYLKEPIPAKSDVQLILSDMTTPGMGMYYLNCLIQAPGDVPIMRNLGTWIVSVTR